MHLKMENYPMSFCPFPNPSLPPSLPPSPYGSRAAYTKRTLWATAYHPHERHPGGEFPNQDPRPVCGLPLYAAKDMSLGRRGGREGGRFLF
jgi:Cu2+-containing amine oxidase